jgi:hypothetical protein
VAVHQPALERAGGAGGDEEGRGPRAREREGPAGFPDDEDDPEPRRRLGELRDETCGALPQRQAIAQEIVHLVGYVKTK